ncbi:MAG: Ig-like domain-containing protein [Myxococcaceae bacterium]
MPFRTLLALPIFLALFACGKESLPQKPQLITDRDSIGFGQEFGSGTYIGTKPQESLLIENKGLEDLVITSISPSGDTEISIEAPSSLTVKGKGHTFIRIFFEPKAAKIYSSTLTIVSNAENAPQKLINISGRGIVPSTDGG